MGESSYGGGDKEEEGGDIEEEGSHGGGGGLDGGVWGFWCGLHTKHRNGIIPFHYNAFQISFQSSFYPYLFPFLFQCTKRYLRVIDPSSTTEWNVDTRAIDHVVSNPGIIKKLISYRGSNYIMVGDGSYLMSQVIIPLSNVLVAPKIAKNLLSVSQLTK